MTLLLGLSAIIGLSLVLVGLIAKGSFSSSHWWLS